MCECLTKQNGVEHRKKALQTDFSVEEACVRPRRLSPTVTLAKSQSFSDLAFQSFSFPSVKWYNSYFTATGRMQRAKPRAGHGIQLTTKSW